jgi:hypothetical protein
MFYVLYQFVTYLLILPRIIEYSAVFWFVTPYSSDILQHFRGTYCFSLPLVSGLPHSSTHGGDMFLRNVG